MLEPAVEIFIADLLYRRKLAETSKESGAISLLFDGLSEDSLQTLLSRSRMKDFPSGQQILQQGDAPEFLYCILAGKVKTQRFSPDGDEATIRMLGKGDTFMDAVLFMGGGSPIGAEAVENSRLLMIPAAHVHAQVLNDGQFACNLLRIVTRHYKTAIQQIDSISTRNPIERLGYYFLKLHLENRSDDLEFTLPFRKAMIASHLGMTPETFSRSLKQIRKLGVDVDQDRLSLRDAYALCHFCDFDTASLCPRYNAAGCAFCADSGQLDPNSGSKG